MLPRVLPDGLRQFTASKAHGKTLLALGIDALVWAALGRDETIDRIVCEQPRQQLAPIAADDARAKLAALMALALRARVEALPFMPKAGFALLQHEDAARALREAEASWRGNFGEGNNPWVSTALRGAEPFVDPAATLRFAELAREVFADLPGLDVDATEVADD